MRDEHHQVILDVFPHLTSARWLDEVRVDVLAPLVIEQAEVLVAFVSVLPVLMFRHERAYGLGRRGGLEG